MVVPGLPTQEQLHEAHTALDQSPGDQAALSVRPGGILIESVHLVDVFGFLRQVQGLLGLDLHGGGQLVAGNPRFQLSLARMQPRVPLVHLLEQSQVLPLHRAAESGRGIEIENPRLLWSQHGPLVQRRHETTGPVPGPIHRVPAWVGQDHVGGQVPRLAPEGITDPTP